MRMQNSGHFVQYVWMIAISKLPYLVYLNIKDFLTVKEDLIIFINIILYAEAVKISNNWFLREKMWAPQLVVVSYWQICRKSKILMQFIIVLWNTHKDLVGKKTIVLHTLYDGKFDWWGRSDVMLKVNVVEFWFNRAKRQSERGVMVLALASPYSLFFLWVKTLPIIRLLCATVVWGAWMGWEIIAALAGEGFSLFWEFLAARERA